MQIPACAVCKCQPFHPDVPAVAHVDKSRPDAPRNRIGIFAGRNKSGILGKVVLQPFPLACNDALCQQFSAGCNRSLAAQNYVFTVWPGSMVKRTEVQQAAVALHLSALKAAGNARQIILWVCCALQHSSFFKVKFHIAVQTQCACAVNTCRKIDLFTLAAVVDGFLQGGSIHGLSIAHSRIRRCSHIQTAFGRCCPDSQFPNAAAPPLNEQRIGRFRTQILQCTVGLLGMSSSGIVQQDGIGFDRTGSGGLIPEQGNACIGAAGGQAVL